MVYSIFYLLSFFPRLFSAVADCMSIPYFHTWCDLSANLGCSLKRAARGSLKIQDAKIDKNSLSAHHRTTLFGLYLLKQLVKQQYLPNPFSQYGELRPTSS